MLLIQIQQERSGSNPSYIDVNLNYSAVFNSDLADLC